MEVRESSLAASPVRKWSEGPVGRRVASRGSGGVRGCEGRSFGNRVGAGALLTVQKGKKVF